MLPSEVMNCHISYNNFQLLRYVIIVWLPLQNLPYIFPNAKMFSHLSSECFLKKKSQYVVNEHN